MAASNGFPNPTTSGQGLFNGASSSGYVQGQAQPDPATRFALRSAIVAEAETIVMWGGIGVYAHVPPISTSGPAQALGEVIGRATQIAAAATSLVGFSTFDQAYNLVNDPQNPVPTAGSGQNINYYPLGSRARLAVKCAPGLVNLRGGQINPQVSWDFVNQMLVPYAPAYNDNVITNAVWASTGGGQVTFTVTDDPSSEYTSGDVITVTGVVNTGGSSTDVFNGVFVVKSVSSSTVVVEYLASGSPGTYASGGKILAGGGALPVTVLDVQPEGNIVVDYDAVTGRATYNYNGSAALIQLTGGTTA